MSEGHALIIGKLSFLKICKFLYFVSLQDKDKTKVIIHINHTTIGGQATL